MDELDTECEQLRERVSDAEGERDELQGVTKDLEAEKDKLTVELESKQVGHFQHKVVHVVISFCFVCSLGRSQSTTTSFPGCLFFPSPGVGRETLGMRLRAPYLPSLKAIHFIWNGSLNHCFCTFHTETIGRTAKRKGATTIWSGRI